LTKNAATGYHARDLRRHKRPESDFTRYNTAMQRKVFWTIFIALSLIADFALPILWSVLATIPIAMLSWWVAYRSDWF
jgi:hypothetical protein